MRITIEDLEALKELSDELEENHMETEKQLHEDLGLWNFIMISSDTLSHNFFFRLEEVKEAQIREHLRKVEGLEEICIDYEGTIQQFRELVLQLQTFVSNFYNNFLFNAIMILHIYQTVSLTNYARKPKLLNLNQLLRLLARPTSCPST
jgi:hypothetical protein